MEIGLEALGRSVYWPLARAIALAAGGQVRTMTFDEAYQRYLSTVLRVASRAVGRRDVGEEITADAFLELHRQFDRIDTGQLPGWLLTVVRNRAIDYWRRQQVERRYLEEGSMTPPPMVAQPGSSGSLFSHPSLKPIHRACLTLRYEYGLTREEIGRRLGLSETQVRGHLQYSLTLLRKSLGRER